MHTPAAPRLLLSRTHSFRSRLSEGSAGRWSAVSLSYGFEGRALRSEVPKLSVQSALESFRNDSQNVVQYPRRRRGKVQSHVSLGRSASVINPLCSSRNRHPVVFFSMYINAVLYYRKCSTFSSSRVFHCVSRSRKPFPNDSAACNSYSIAGCLHLSF